MRVYHFWWWIEDHWSVMLAWVVLALAIVWATGGS